MPEQTSLDQAPDAVGLAHRLYKAARDHSSQWRQQARTEYDMVAGDQWPQEDLLELQEDQRPAVTFNRIMRTINAIIGTQVANRQETRFIPREQGDVEVNEVLTAAAEWFRDETDAEDEESDAFEDMCVCGMGWTDTRLDYDSDPDGTGRIDRIDPLEMYWDPGATKRNLSDALWVMRVKQMDRAEFHNQWPGVDVSSASAPWESVEDDVSVRVHVYPQDAYKEQQRLKKDTARKQTIRVVQLQWAEHDPIYRVGKKASRMSADKFEKLEPKLKEAGIRSLKQREVTWKQAFIAGGTVLDEGPCPYPQGPTMRAMTYKRNRNKNTWYGIVAGMIDPQRWGNKFFSQILDILNKGAKGGILIEADATDDIRDLESKWARSDAVHVLRSGAISGKKIMPKPIVTLPPALDNLMAFSMDAVHEITGVNLELLGFANRQQAGVLEQQRKQAGLTILAPLFDALRRHRKETGRVLLYFIQTYLSDGRLVRIMGENGKEKYVPLAKQPETAKYDVIVDESPTSPNMKERVYASLVEMLPSLGKMGIPLPPELLDYAPIPSALASKWKEMIEKGGNDPEAMEKAAQEMRDQLEGLAKENAQLKDKREQSAAELQMKAQETQAEMQLKAEEQQAEQQLAEQEHAAKLEQMDREYALKAREANHKMQLAELELGVKLQIEDARADAEVERKDKAAETKPKAA